MQRLAKIGAILVTANTSLRAKDIDYLLRQSEAGTIVTISGFRQVDYIEAQDDYVAVRTAERVLLKEQTMAELERQLDPRRFVRIHRSVLLNLDRLVRLEPTGKDSRMAVLRDGRRLPVSRSGYARLQELL